MVGSDGLVRMGDKVAGFNSLLWDSLYNLEATFLCLVLQFLNLYLCACPFVDWIMKKNNIRRAYTARQSGHPREPQGDAEVTLKATEWSLLNHNDRCKTEWPTRAQTQEHFCEELQLGCVKTMSIICTMKIICRKTHCLSPGHSFPKECCNQSQEQFRRDGRRTERNVLWGGAKDSRCVWFGQKEAEGHPHCSLQLDKKAKQRGRCWCLHPDKMSRNGSKLCQSRFRLTLGSTALPTGGQTPQQAS